MIARTNGAAPEAWDEDAFDRWLKTATIGLEAIDPGDADVVLIGELNHFVHERSDFRITFARRFIDLGFEVGGEELGWSDGARISDYFRTRDEAIFDQIGLFGWRGESRTDRVDAPPPVFREAMAAYPTAQMRAENTRFYRSIRPRAWFGFDIAAGHDGGYRDIEATILRAPEDRVLNDWRARLARVRGESLEAEIARLLALAASPPPAIGKAGRAALAALIEGLRYTALLAGAETYEATRLAMAFREDAMKRRFEDARAEVGARIMLFGHALHLAKHDALIDAPGVIGPGGDRVPSLGDHIVRTLGLKTFSVWMIYGAGEDSQPLYGLPRKAQFAPDTLNARLARHFVAPTLLLTRDAPNDPTAVGHMYNAVFRTSLPAQVDALYFIPQVTPMRA